MQLGEDKFTKFAAKAQDYINQNFNILKNHEQVDNANMRALYINLHTLKGISRTFSLHLMAGAIHEVESGISATQKAGGEGNSLQLQSEHEQIQASLDHYVDLGKSQLMWFKNEDYIKISKSVLEKLLPELSSLTDDLTSVSSKSKLEELEAVLRSSTLTHLEDLIYEVSHGLDSLARDLGKQPPKINIEHTGVFLDNKACDCLSSALTHLLRNSLDHGLESTEQRQHNGKSPEGHLSFQVRTSKDWLEIRYSDDGRGLDLERIRSKALENSIITEDLELSPQQTAELIFEAGFSTKQEVTDISGRGVGMDAVRSMLESLGGVVELNLGAETEGSCRSAEFVLRIP